MHAKNFVVNESSNRHAVKDILEFFPDTDRVSALAFIIKSVDSVDLSTLVVTTE
jgi:hypothetical protein